MMREAEIMMREAEIMMREAKECPGLTVICIN